jgi:hypothetical protein
MCLAPTLIMGVFLWTAQFNNSTHTRPPEVFCDDAMLQKYAGDAPRVEAAFVRGVGVVLPSNYTGHWLHERAILAHEFTHALGFGEREAYTTAAEYERTRPQF